MSVLLRQPHGGKGFRPGVEVGPPEHPPAPPARHLPERLLDRGVAAGAVGMSAPGCEGHDQIVVFFLQRARPSGSSAFVERRAAHVWTMRDGKATKLQIFPRRQSALEAAGLSEQDAHADS